MAGIICISVLTIFALLVVLSAGRKLSEHEQRVLLCSRQLELLKSRVGWSTSVQTACALEKKAMKPRGALHRCSIPREDFPSHAAGLLKGKKHEGIVWGFCDNAICHGYWTHKGPDGTKVYIQLSNEEIERLARSVGADVVYDLHNHPNPDPKRFTANRPSDADLNHAQSLGPHLSSRGICYVAYVAERGMAFPYALYIPYHIVPARKDLIDIASRNVRFRDRLGLRRELSRTQPLARSVAGPRFATNLGRTN